MVDIVGGSCCYVARSDTESVDCVWHRNMLRQLSAGKNEEWLATNHDVGVVGVVIHLLIRSPNRLCHLHHLFVRIRLGIFAVTSSRATLPYPEIHSNHIDVFIGEMPP